MWICCISNTGHYLLTGVNNPANGCRDYPNLEFLSYEECDDLFLRNLLPGLTPVWMTEDFDKVSTQVSDEDGTFGELLLTSFWTDIVMPPFQGVLSDLVDGSLRSDCPLPCKTTQTQAKYLYQYTLATSQIDITFSSKVKITKTDLVKPALSSFLSEVWD